MHYQHTTYTLVRTLIHIGSRGSQNGHQKYSCTVRNVASDFGCNVPFVGKDEKKN